MLKHVTLLALGGWLALAGAAQAQAVAFAPVTTWLAGSFNSSRPKSIVIADVTGDAKPDLLVAGSGTGTLEVLITRTGGFNISSLSAGQGSAPMDLAVADVNSDGKLDVLTADYFLDAVGVLLGNGNGVFQITSSFSCGAGSKPTAIAVADVNGDGKPDALTSNYNLGTVAVLLGNGNGTFQPAASYPTGTIYSNPNDIALADVNGDGKLDVLTANSNAYSMGVLLGNGNGTFQPVASYPAGGPPRSFAVADVNGDTKLDLVTVYNQTGVVAVLLGNGNGTFQASVQYPTSGFDTSSIAIADLNRDNKPDLVIADYSSNSAGVLLGNGNGTFQIATAYSAGVGSAPYGIAVADLNADSRPDIVTANYGSASVGILMNTTILANRATLPGTSATLHPNPATVATALTVAGLPATVAQVRATLLDATGRAVGRQQLSAAQGTARAEVPTAGLAAGLYVLRLTAYDAQGQPIGSLPPQRLSVQ